MDDPTDDDNVEEKDGFTFCVSKDLLATIGGVNIDLSYMGFVVEPQIPLTAQGESSSCGSCGSGGSCSI